MLILECGLPNSFYLSIFLYDTGLNAQATFASYLCGQIFRAHLFVQLFHTSSFVGWSKMKWLGKKIKHGRQQKIGRDDSS